MHPGPPDSAPSHVTTVTLFWCPDLVRLLSPVDARPGTTPFPPSSASPPKPDPGADSQLSGVGSQCVIHAELRAPRGPSLLLSTLCPLPSLQFLGQALPCRSRTR